MAKRSHSFLALVTGLAAGAAAVFLSKKENRDLAKKNISTASATLRKAKADYDKDPKGFTKKIQQEGKKLAKKTLAQVSKKAKSTAKSVATSTKTAAAKKISPAASHQTTKTNALKATTKSVDKKAPKKAVKVAKK